METINGMPVYASAASMPFIGNPHGVDEIGFHSSMKPRSLVGGASNGDRTEPLPDSGAQAHGPRGSGSAGALVAFLNALKATGTISSPLRGKSTEHANVEARYTSSAAFHEVTDPVLVQWGSGHQPRRGFALR